MQNLPVIVDSLKSCRKQIPWDYHGAEEGEVFSAHLVQWEQISPFFLIFYSLLEVGGITGLSSVI